MIHDIRQTVRRSQGFWRHLPYSLCSANQETLFSRVLRESRNAEIRHDSTRNTQQSRLSSSLSHKLDLDLEKNTKNNLCWNGEDSAPYNAEVIADGLTNQARNPEVSLTAIVPPEIVRDQIYRLQTITNQLKQAHRGHDVEWWDNEEIQNNRDHEDMIEIEGSGYDSSEGSGGMPYLEDDDEDQPRKPVPGMHSEFMGSDQTSINLSKGDSGIAGLSPPCQSTTEIMSEP